MKSVQGKQHHQLGSGREQFVATAVLACALSLPYWFAVSLFSIFDRPDFGSTVWPILRTVLPICLIASIVSVSFTVYAVRRWSHSRSSISAIAVGLWLLSGISFAFIPLHFFWVAGSGI